MSSLEGEMLDLFHDYVCGILVFILFLVGRVLYYLMFSSWLYIGLVEASIVEFIWTIFPMVVLFFIGLPRMFFLYYHEVEFERELTVKVTAHQWYWSYDYSGLENVEFDRFIIPLNELILGDFRLLEVDNRVVLPWYVRTGFAITSSDVLHSWGLPPLGIKVDATPGRLRFVYLYVNELGLYYGQCREICGANHSFIPICVEVVLPSLFARWLTLF